MKKTKIDWCDATVNPVIGCKRGCPYCYAKKINDRFHFVDDFSKPELKEKALKPIFTENIISVFFDSMSDFDYWTNEEINLFQKWVNESNCFFIGLTKSPQALYRIRNSTDMSIDLMMGLNGYANGVFLGYTIDTKEQIKKIKESNEPLFADFLSLEPLEEDIAGNGEFWDIVKEDARLSVAIIGAETGNRKGKVICKKEWVDGLVANFDALNIPVFMKSSLKDIMGNDFRQDKLPWPCGKK